MVADNITFTACVHIERSQWQFSIREEYGPRSEFIVRSDITAPATDPNLDQAWDAVDDAGWFVDRVTSRRDPGLALTVANMTPRIPSTNFSEEWVFIARAMARGVPFSVARQGFKDGFREPVEFANHYTWEALLDNTPADELHHVTNTD